MSTDPVILAALAHAGGAAPRQLRLRTGARAALPEGLPPPDLPPDPKQPAAGAPSSPDTTLVPELELNAAGRTAAPRDASGDRVSERPQEASPSEAGGVGEIIEAMGQERGDEHCRRASTYLGATFPDAPKTRGVRLSLGQAVSSGGSIKDLQQPQPAESGDGGAARREQPAA